MCMTSTSLGPIVLKPKHFLHPASKLGRFAAFLCLNVIRKNFGFRLLGGQNKSFENLTLGFTKFRCDDITDEKK